MNTSDFDACWTAHQERVLAPRGDELFPHMGDLHSCDYATWSRLQGEAPLPYDDDTFANFERGHAIEARLFDALKLHFTDYTVIHGAEIEYEGILGHLDFQLFDDADRCVAVIDVSTTAAKSPDWKYGHALKSAGYAIAVGAPVFIEWVFSVGFGGKIVAQKAHVFDTKEWTTNVRVSVARVNALVAAEDAPEMQPPFDPLANEYETWRCGKPGSGKSYCQNASCSRNARLSADGLLGAMK